MRKHIITRNVGTTMMDEELDPETGFPVDSEDDDTEDEEELETEDDLEEEDLAAD